MFKRAFRLPSPALVISMIALGLVLGGTAVAASVGGDTAADTTLIKKLAPSLSVKKAKTADALGRVTYVTGNTVDAPGNGGSGFHETAASIATCPLSTIVIGTADLAATAKALGSLGIAHDGAVSVPAAAANGVVLSFVPQ